MIKTLFIVFSFIYGHPTIQAEMLETDIRDCLRLGNELKLLLTDHPHIKEYQFHCLTIKDIGREG